MSALDSAMLTPTKTRLVSIRLAPRALDWTTLPLLFLETTMNTRGTPVENWPICRLHPLHIHCGINGTGLQFLDSVPWGASQNRSSSVFSLDPIPSLMKYSVMPNSSTRLPRSTKSPSTSATSTYSLDCRRLLIELSIFVDPTAGVSLLLAQNAPYTLSSLSQVLRNFWSMMPAISSITNPGMSTAVSPFAEVTSWLVLFRPYQPRSLRLVSSDSTALLAQEKPQRSTA